MSSELERLPPPVDDGHHMLVWAAAELCRAAHYEGTDEDAARRLIAAGKHIKEHADKMKFGMAQANSTLRQQLAAATERLANVRTKLNEATECYAAGREMFEVIFLVNCCIEDIEKTIWLPAEQQQQGGG